MDKRYLHKEIKLYFSCWSRKGYAVFVALGKNVRISAVSLDVCETALLKSARKGTIVREYEEVLERVADEQTTDKQYGGFVLQEKVCPDADRKYFQDITVWKGYAA